MKDLDRSILTYSEAGRAALAEIERLAAERDAEKARADAAEQMVAELRDRLRIVREGLRGTHYLEPGMERSIDATLAHTEPVAGRWVRAAERDAARAEVERLRAQLAAALATIEAAALSETP